MGSTRPVLTGFLRAYLRPYRSRIALIAGLQLVQTVCILLLPTLNALVIDNGVVEGSMGWIVGVGVAMGAVTLVQVTVAISAERKGAAVSAALGRDLRSAVFRRVLSLSAREVDHFGTPSLITRTVNDVKHAQTLTLTLFDTALATAILSIGGVVLAVTQDFWLGLLLVAMFLTVCGCIGFMIATMAPLFERLQTGIDLISRILREQIIGVRVVRAFVQQRREHERFDAANRFIFQPSLRVGRLMTTFAAMVTLVTNIFMTALVWFGGRRIDDGSLQLGTLSALIGYLTLIVLAMVMILVVVTGLSRALASVRRITEVLDSEPSVDEPAVPVQSRTEGGFIEVREVDFGHPGSEAPVLHRVDLVVRRGETVALVGGTGSGKSTLLNLVLRRYDVTGGAIRIDGVDVRDLSADRLTTLVGVVPQTTRLFSGTVRENLHFGDPGADDTRLWWALRVAQAESFVAELPDGLDTPLAQGGRSLSGGQRQRLAIARTLLRRPRVLLLDDCFSALDGGTESRLRAALRHELSGTTVLLTSQRAGAVRDADRIVVLDAGRLAGDGRHADLIRDCRVYREIVQSQPLGTETPGREAVDAAHD
ncbi:ABC transporter ATP-binding protein [Actinoplanes sp. LDG1-06]|uniref:ABC transporter ATP-binding protein n=1 Tax=Paractinoplanes ovalisporus TaxID=2810368 RepID=A0ABS2AIM0_9ACTN|nr:ABC transporter ATP-binding protein [Actinoplanes ovalisporus]MBM2619681.1 ABC transporter ATP-binding protein [Actinoplanes ovalisporus]